MLVLAELILLSGSLQPNAVARGFLEDWPVALGVSIQANEGFAGENDNKHRLSWPARLGKSDHKTTVPDLDPVLLIRGRGDIISWIPCGGR